MNRTGVVCKMGEVVFRGYVQREAREERKRSGTRLDDHTLAKGSDFGVESGLSRGILLFSFESGGSRGRNGNTLTRLLDLEVLGTEFFLITPL